MKRIAIIIGNEGSTIRNFLPGVGKDLENYKNFLFSDIGGAWEENEIFCRKDWTSMTLEHTIKQQKDTGAEYFMIIFSGHGYAIENQGTYLEIADNDELSVGDIMRWLQFNKSLIIADSCRKFITLTEKAQSIIARMTFSNFRQTYRYAYRALYDREIENLEPHHHTFVASTDEDECADDTNEGGLYSKSLLETAKAVEDHGGAGVYSIRSLHDVAAKKVSGKTEGRQNPQIYSSSRFKTPPFVVKPAL